MLKFLRTIIFGVMDEKKYFFSDKYNRNVSK